MIPLENEMSKPTRNFRRAPKAQSKTVRRGKKNNKNSLLSVASSNVTTSIVERTLPLFPVKTTRRLRYSDNFSLASTSGAVSTYVLGANCLFDPNITGTGHQPMGFDEMMLYYNHYTVVECMLTLVAKAVSSSKMTVMLRMDSSSTPITVIDRLVELGGVVIEHISNTGVYGDSKVMRLGLDIAKIQGVNKSALTADTSLRGTSGANPSEITYFHVNVCDAAGLTGTVNFDMVMDFVAVFTEPRDATESVEIRARQLINQSAVASLTALGGRKTAQDEKHN